MHKIAIKRQMVENFPPSPPQAKPSRRLPGAAPHRAFVGGPLQWNFIEPPHPLHTLSHPPRFCTIFGLAQLVNLEKLFEQETARE